jgi:two-component system, sensor histidine kinase and response regulator
MTERNELILIVDDIPTNLKVLMNLLKKKFQLRAATNGADALRLVQNKQPDLILLDIMMPDMDGYEVCRRLKTDDKTKNIPVIFITALRDVEDKTRGFNVGGADFITKPFDVPEVLARIKTQLKIKKQHDELVDAYENLKMAEQLRLDVERITRHDLKGPLNGIIGIANLYKLEYDLSDEQLQWIQSIEDSGYRVLSMINLSLDLYKMETGVYKYIPAEINLIPIINRTMVNFENQRRTKELEFVITVNGKKSGTDTVFEMVAEEMLCFTMLENLLKNSIEASPSKEKITISLEKKENDFSISIHNMGAVPPDIRGRFFEKYATYGKRAGTGLGTYSARLLARTQGGDITMSSSDETGTTVIVSFPYDFENL